MIEEVLSPSVPGMDSGELAEWLESLDDLAAREGTDQVERLLTVLISRARRHGAQPTTRLQSAYVNTIPVARSATVSRRPAARTPDQTFDSLECDGHGGSRQSGASRHWRAYLHLCLRCVRCGRLPSTIFCTPERESTRAISSTFRATLRRVIYARAYLEGRLTEQQLERFRQESPRETGLSSYPHPWLMPEFWQFPTVSMGLSPIMAIYQARWLRYLQHRGIADTSKARVWCFLGDGEMDEPESIGGLSLAARDQLDNLIFVVNCNLQRLDGPVRGNGKIIQELESLFRGAGWNCIKVIWGSDWDPLLEADEEGRLRQRMEEVVDGQYQKYAVESGDYIREDFFGASPELLAMVDDFSDEQMRHSTGVAMTPRRSMRPTTLPCTIAANPL